MRLCSSYLEDVEAWLRFSSSLVHFALLSRYLNQGIIFTLPYNESFESSNCKQVGRVDIVYRGIVFMIGRDKYKKILIFIFSFSYALFFQISLISL